MATKNISFLSAKRRERDAKNSLQGTMRVLCSKDSAIEMEFCDEAI